MGSRSKSLLLLLAHPPNIYEENRDGGTNQLPNKGSDAAGPSRPGTDCRPVMPVPQRVVEKARKKQESHHLGKDREHAL